MESLVFFFILLPIILAIYEFFKESIFQSPKSTDYHKPQDFNRLSNDSLINTKDSTLYLSAKSEETEEKFHPSTNEYLLPILEIINDERLIGLDSLMELIVHKMNLSFQVVSAEFSMGQLQEYTSNMFIKLLDSFARKLNLSIRFATKNYRMPVYHIRVLESLAYLSEAGCISIDYPNRGIDGKFLKNDGIAYIKLTADGFKLLSSSNKSIDCETLFKVIDSKKKKDSWGMGSNNMNKNEHYDNPTRYSSPWDDVPSINELFNEGDLD